MNARRDEQSRQASGATGLAVAGTWETDRSQVRERKGRAGIIW
jgi:hypothetical protein